MSPRIYFAGAAQHSWCDWLGGLHVLESFADIQGLMDRYRPTFAGMCLDSGAFTEMKTGRPIDLGAYIDFCQLHGGFYDFVASLDSIRGGVAANLANWRRMLDAGVAAVPTFHQGEPMSLLRDYCAAAPMIGLGFQRPIEGARAWLDECFSHIPEATRVHGWGMTSYTDYPFHSVDSHTWFHEARALLGVEGQGADALRCLTQRELLEIVIKKYERLPRRKRWEGSKPAVQGALFGEAA